MVAFLNSEKHEQRSLTLKKSLLAWQLRQPAMFKTHRRKCVDIEIRIHLTHSEQSTLFSLTILAMSWTFTSDLNRNAAFYWAHELIFTRNKLIVFTTSRELSHYVVFSWMMAERKVGVVLKSMVFSFYVYIPLFLRILSLHNLRLKKMRQIYLLIEEKH